MNEISEILIALGRIEGRLLAFENLSQRVSILERWQSWLKGGWAMLIAASAWLFRGGFAR